MEYQGNAIKTSDVLYLIKNWCGKDCDFSYANLQGADLRRADLQGADLRRANLLRADLQGANLREADLREADLREADLQGANLQGADLREADFDYSCLPIWCGGQSAQIDEKLAMQFLIHSLGFKCESDEYNKIKEFAREFCKKSHVAKHLDWVK